MQDAAAATWEPDLAQLALGALLGWVVACLGVAAVVAAAADCRAPLCLAAFAAGAGLGAGAAYAMAEGLLRTRAWPLALVTGPALALLVPLAGAYELQLLETGSPVAAAREVTEALRQVWWPHDAVSVLLAAGSLLPVVALRARGAGLARQSQAALAAGGLALLLRVACDPRTLDAPLWLAALLHVGLVGAAPVALLATDRLVRRARGRPRPAEARPVGRVTRVALGLTSGVALAGAAVLALAGARPDEPPWSARLRARLALLGEARVLRWVHADDRLVEGSWHAELPAFVLLSCWAPAQPRPTSGLDAGEVLRRAGAHERGWTSLPDVLAAWRDVRSGRQPTRHLVAVTGWSDVDRVPGLRDWAWAAARGGDRAAWDLLAGSRDLTPAERREVLDAHLAGDDVEWLRRLLGDHRSEAETRLVELATTRWDALEALLVERCTQPTRDAAETILLRRARTEWPARALVVREALRHEPSAPLLDCALGLLRADADEEVRHGRLACRRALARLLEAHPERRRPDDAPRLPAPHELEPEPSTSSDE